MPPLRDTRRIQVAAVGLAFALFGAIDLIVLLFTPVAERGAALLPPIFSGIVVLITVPFLFSLFEKQQVRIERQANEIETLHAMDAAIFSEMELPRLLPVAVDKALTACDGDASGVALYDPTTSKLIGEAFRMPDIAGEDAKNHFMSLVRRGVDDGDGEWELLVSVMPGNRKADTESRTGFLVVARRRANKRPFVENDRRLLDSLAGTLRIAVTNSRALIAAREALAVREELQVTRERQKRDQALARAMTEGLLPEIPARIGAWLFSNRYQAQSDAAPVGGDLYDLFQIAPRTWGVFIADVSGKGLEAARRVALVKYALRSYAREHSSPAAVLSHLNETLFDEPELTGFVTLFYAVLDESSPQVLWASAGHETPILRRSGGEQEILMPTGPILGAMNDITYEEGCLLFNPGDGLLLFTDGLSEARSVDDHAVMMEVSGVQRALESICLSNELTDKSTPSVPVADALMSVQDTFTGGNLSDDTALLWIQFLPGPVITVPVD